MEAAKAKRNGTENDLIKSVKSPSSLTSSLSSASTKSPSSLSPASSTPSTTPSTSLTPSPLSSPPPSPISSSSLSTPTTAAAAATATRSTLSASFTKIKNTASRDQPGRKVKMGKPKAMEISAKLAKGIKGCCKGMGSVKPVADPKINWVIRTRSQNNNPYPPPPHPSHPNNNHSTRYPMKSTCGGTTQPMLSSCDIKPNPLPEPNGNSNIIANGISSTSIPCNKFTFSKDNPIQNYLAASIISGKNCDKPRPKIMAQRKFASITYSCNSYLKPRESEFIPLGELFTEHKPTPEDFLTFLCFKSTQILPNHLDFYALNNITPKDDQSPDGIAIVDQTASPNRTNAINLTAKLVNHHHHQSPNNCNSPIPSTKIENRKGLPNRKVRCEHKRAFISVNRARKNATAEVLTSKLLAKRKNAKTSNGNPKNCEKVKLLTKNVVDKGKTKIVRRKKTETTCEPAPTLPSSSTLSRFESSPDENRPKESSYVLYSPTKGSPISFSPRKSSPHKSNAKVPVPRKRKAISNGTNLVGDHRSIPNPFANSKTPRNLFPKPPQSSVKVEKVRTKKGSKGTCERILRSTRSSSSTATLNINPINEIESVNQKTPTRTTESGLKRAINGENEQSILIRSPEKRRASMDNGKTVKRRKNPSLMQSSSPIEDDETVHSPPIINCRTTKKNRPNKAASLSTPPSSSTSTSSLISTLSELSQSSETKNLISIVPPHHPNVQKRRRTKR